MNGVYFKNQEKFGSIALEDDEVPENIMICIPVVFHDMYFGRSCNMICIPVVTMRRLLG